uniref:TetR/AcrR family transcriptional regulator n=1 Tax=Phenylobacterium glaciei TaxID=2803784 RepID=A0A974P3H8_9CAUL|nr:TetR/AcrR family transcriptional regulator [Phenylobacterium glaciei]
MRYSEDHKAETRDRVVKAAANAMRRLGPDRVSVAEIMSEVGLTHGGFYAHFKSKDALVGAAVEAAFAQSRWRLGKLALNDDPQILLAGLVDFYVSADHRDHPSAAAPSPCCRRISRARACLPARPLTPVCTVLSRSSPPGCRVARSAWAWRARCWPRWPGRWPCRAPSPIPNFPIGCWPRAAAASRPAWA